MFSVNACFKGMMPNKMTIKEVKISSSDSKDHYKGTIQNKNLRLKTHGPLEA